MSDYKTIYNFFTALLKNDTLSINNHHKAIIEKKLDISMKSDLNSFLSKAIYESITVGSIEPIKFIAENYQHCIFFSGYDLEYAYCLDRLDIIKYLIDNKLILVEDIEYIGDFINQGFNERTSVETIKYLLSVGFVIDDMELLFYDCLKFKKLDIYKYVYDISSVSKYSIKLENGMLLKSVLYGDFDSLKWLISIFNSNQNINSNDFYNLFDNVKCTSFILDKFEYLLKEYPKIINILIKTYYVDLLDLFNKTNENLDLINRPCLRQFLYKLKEKFGSTIRASRNEELPFLFVKIAKELETFEQYKTMTSNLITNFTNIHQDVVKFVLSNYI